MATPISYWVGFHLLLAVMLAADLAGWRKGDAMSTSRAARWAVVWVMVAAGFAVFVWHAMGTAAATQFATGYLIETSLSVDNLFIFLMLFGVFQINESRRRTVLFWGVLGAVVFRAAFIGAGVQLLARFGWMRTIFAVVILLAAGRLQMADDKKTPRWLLWLQRVHPVSLRQDAFYVMEDGRRMVTVLLLALIAIEVADVVFALDSIPAVLSVTQHPFIAYTSNIMAVMGLRSLYFVLAGALQRLRLLRYGLSAVLVFVGARMLLAGVVTVSAGASLLVIVGVLAATIVASLLMPAREAATSR